MIRADPRLGVELRSVARRLLAAAITVVGNLSKAEYRSIVAKVVAAIAAQQVPEDQVYPLSLGAFPTVVKSALGGLARSAEVSSRSDGLIPSADPAPWEHDELDLIDSQWYFDVPSVTRIMSYFPPGGRSMVALGTPTVAAMAAAVVPEVTLVDISLRFWRDQVPKWLDVRRVERVRHDLDEKIYDGVTDADVVVMDPPWYIENYRAWLKSAVAVCREGGLIAVTLPQILTNRRTLPEREEILNALRSIGSVKVENDVLTYVTPTFEAAVLEANGLGFLRRWRRADLALVVVENRSLSYEFQPFGGDAWNYREVHRQIVRTHNEAPSNGRVPIIEPLRQDREYRLDQVGRNYLWSCDANLITSRGRAASVHHWGALPQILDLQQAGYPVDSAVMDALPDEPIEDLRALIAMLRTLVEC